MVLGFAVGTAGLKTMIYRKWLIMKTKNIRGDNVRRLSP